MQNVKVDVMNTKNDFIIYEVQVGNVFEIKKISSKKEKCYKPTKMTS